MVVERKSFRSIPSRGGARPAAAQRERVLHKTRGENPYLMATTLPHGELRHVKCIKGFPQCAWTIIQESGAGLCETARARWRIRTRKKLFVRETDSRRTK